MSDNWYGRAMLADMKAAGVPTTDDAPAPERERRVLARGWAIENAKGELLDLYWRSNDPGSELSADQAVRIARGYDADEMPEFCPHRASRVEIVESRPPAGEE